MKLFEILGYSGYIIGIILKFMFIPYHEIIMLISLVYMFFMYAIMGFNMKVPTTKATAGIAAIFWGGAYLFIIKFYPADIVIAIISLIPTTIAIYYKITRKALIDPQTVIAFSLISASVISYFMPSDLRYETYYMFNNPNIKSDFVLWDKYSWHLYSNDRFKEALAANKLALEMVDVAESEQWKEFIEYHRNLIESDSWEDYHQTKIGDQQYQEDLDNEII